MKTTLGKIALLLIAAVMLLTVCAGAASAVTYSGGDGSQQHPYLISDAADLYNLTQDTENWKKSDGVYFKLTDDIVVTNITSLVTNVDSKEVIVSNGTSSMKFTWGDRTLTFNKTNWHPGYTETLLQKGGIEQYSLWPTIGNETQSVSGNLNFDGNNKKIQGLFINTTEDRSLALFGNVTGNLTITDLTMEHAFVSASGENIQHPVACLIAYAEENPHSEITISHVNINNSAVANYANTCAGIVVCCTEII